MTSSHLRQELYHNYSKPSGPRPRLHILPCSEFFVAFFIVMNSSVKIVDLNVVLSLWACLAHNPCSVALITNYFVHVTAAA